MTTQITIETRAPIIDQTISVVEGDVDGGTWSSNFGATETVDGGTWDSTYISGTDIDGGTLGGATTLSRALTEVGEGLLTEADENLMWEA